MKTLSKTHKAIQQIPKEILNLNKTIQSFGERLIEIRIEKLQQSKEEFNELLKNKRKPVK